MKKHSRILVLNLHKASLFKTDGKKLELEKEFSDDPWKHEREFTDKAGTSNKRVGLRRYALSKGELVNAAVENHFIKEVGQTLNKDLKKKVFQYLYLFAEPQALGFLRKHASKELLSKIVLTAHLDIMPQDPNIVAKYLKQKGVFLQEA